MDVSFAVEKGEIFGLLGSNGAGKTTTIRLMLDIFKPDAGSVSILGGSMTEAKKDRIGYMPEERGLYQEMTLESCLTYLGTLKGMSKSDARRRLAPYLDRFDPVILSIPSESDPYLHLAIFASLGTIVACPIDFAGFWSPWPGC